MNIREEKGCGISKRNTVFKDISVLAFDYQPPESPVRREELQRLIKIFEPVLTSNSPQSVFIGGPVSSGKTELVKRFSERFEERSNERGISVHIEFINCRRTNTNHAVLMKILNNLMPNYRDLGHSISEMLKILYRELEKQKIHLIIVLEEVDILINKNGSKLIFQLSTFCARENISLILTSQKDMQDIHDSSLIDLFDPEYVIHLNKFTREEILMVLNQRVKLAFHGDIVEIGVVELISDISSEWGDVRYAIELLEKTGMLADEDNEEYITLDHVRTAKADTYSSITESKLEALDLHGKLILLAVAQSLRHKAYTNTDEVEYRYTEGCISFGVNRLAHRRFREGLKALANSYIIVISDAECGDPEKMTIALQDISARSLEAKLIELYCSHKKRENIGS